MRTTLLLLFVIGCGGGGSNTALEGIYTVGTWTRNPTACAAEGPSVASQHDMFFYIKDENFLGSHFLNVNGCMDIAECEMEANDADTIHIGQFAFEKGNDSSGWTQRSAFAFDVQGQCMGGVTETVLTASAKNIRIEQKHFEAVPFPPVSGEDECPDDKVEAAVSGQPCDEFEVVTASFNKDF